MTDVIDTEAGVVAGVALDTLRRARPGARESSQESFRALFQPADAGAFPVPERAAVAQFVAALTGVDVRVYRDIVGATDASLSDAVDEIAARARTTGPFGRYPAGAVAGESTDGRRWTASAEDSLIVGARLAAALEHAHLLVYRPREASPAALEALAQAGWSIDETVTLAQLVTFVAYQLRVIHALRVLGSDGTPAAAPTLTEAAAAAAAPTLTDAAADTADPRHPPSFTQAPLWWEPWLAPLDRDALTPAQKHGMVEPARAALPYFRLLARDPGILRARTLADLDIFTNDDGGLPRAERELAATAVSRLNGCVFCASVHARAASKFSGRADDVQSLLDEGVGVRLADARWSAVVDAAAALAATPPTFDASTVQALADAGLAPQEVFDLASSAAFFSWANRLMLSLGTPVVPDDTTVIREYESRVRPAPTPARA